jgi:regulation of enolase protein 1 (concanavalin A-like superfamily)
VPPLPMDLRWLSDPEGWELEAGTLRIVAGPGTDWFTDPGGRPPSLNAPALAGPVEGAFRLSARVAVEFRSTFDAGGLVVYGNEGRWAKLCLEYSPQGEATVVSVVTRGLSDDCTSIAVEGGALWLRVARLGPDVAFHVSSDGARWLFVRHFALEGEEGILAGFEAQSPTGPGCAVTFTDIDFSGAPSAELRDGS